MPTFSFDIVSKLDLQEVSNAVNQTIKEVQQRYDLKNAQCKITLSLEELKIALQAVDDFSVKAVYEILSQKIVKRNISPKALVPGKITSALGGTAKQDVTLQNGLSTDNAKLIVKEIKTTKIKVQTQIQNEQIRISAPKKDDLQQIIQLVKEKNFQFPLQFTNYR